MTRLVLPLLLLLLFLISTLCSGSYVTGGGDVLYVEENETPEITWLVSHKDNEIEDSTDRGKVVRSKRSPKQPPKFSKPVSTGQFELIKPESCRERLRRLCGVMDKEMDDLFFLECIQTFKVGFAVRLFL